MEENKKEEIQVVHKELPDADVSGVDQPGIWDNPLWMPAGSIRSIIAMVILIGFMIYVFKYPTVPPELKDVVLLVLGFYFGTRTK